MPRMIYVNLPVQNVAAATRFYEAIGCEKNEQFSDEKASSMVWSDSIAFQLLTRDYFATFSPKPVADAHASCQVLLALTCESPPRRGRSLTGAGRIHLEISGFASKYICAPVFPRARKKAGTAGTEPSGA